MVLRTFVVMIPMTAIVLAAIWKAIMDLSSINSFSRPYWNKGESWRYKWKVPMEGYNRAPWWYLWLYKPQFKERYPYSSTLLVFTTDGWHLAQFFTLKLLIAGIVFAHYFPILTRFGWWTMAADAVFLTCVFYTVFQLTYEQIKKF